MKKEILIYTAGLFDGEGCIIIQRSQPYKEKGQISPSYWLNVNVAMTDKATIDWLKGTFGGSIADQTSRKNRPNRQPYYHWRITSQNAIPFLKSILPYLRVKKEQAKLAIQFQSQKHKHTSHKLTPQQIQWRESFKLKISQLTPTQRYYKSSFPDT